MTWNELAEFIESLSADERKQSVEVRPDAILTDPPKVDMGSVLSLSCCMPAVGGYPKPCLMFAGKP